MNHHSHRRPSIKFSKHGHLLRKNYEEGDDKLLLEPHRDNSGVFVYKKYKTYNHKESFLLDCSCDYYGTLCDHCEVLNTSSFYDLTIPLNPEDFQLWKQFFLQKEKWSEENLYNWFSFWILQFENRWYGYYHNKQLVFFSYDKFFYMDRHKFFYYLFQFTTRGEVFSCDPFHQQPLPVGVNGGVIKKPNQKRKRNHIAIRTGDAMFRFTYKLYKSGGRVNSIESSRTSIIGFTYEKDARKDTFSFQLQKMKRDEKQRWKRVFQYTIDEINNEVRFRPNMCGMQECQLSFLQSSTMMV